MKALHCIFFDASCSLCRKSVEQLIKRDKKKQFFFAPLDGETARTKLMGSQMRLQKAASIILMENYATEHSKIWVKAGAIFRIFWLLKGKFRSIGWLCFVPWGFDWIYFLIARFRHHISWKNSQDKLYKYPERFLP